MKSQLIAIVAAVLVVGCATTQSPEPPTAEAPRISIIRAAGTGNIEAVKQHLDAGVDVNTKNKQGRTPLSAATTTEIAELLIANGADVNAKTTTGRTPLHNADTKGIAELLIAKGADVNAKNDDGVTPLDTAIVGFAFVAQGKVTMHKHPELADLLRKHGGKTGAELKAEAK